MKLNFLSSLLIITFCIANLNLTTFAQFNDTVYNEEANVLETETGNIHGTLLIPKTKKKPKVILIIAGSGPTDRNGNNIMMTNNSLKLLAEGLYKKGYATLRYDKRGVGESKDALKNSSDIRFEHLVNDAVEWVQKLNKDKRFNEVIIIGHSIGSLIGILACQKSKVKGFISLAGVGRPGGELLDDQLQQQPTFVYKAAKPILDSLMQQKTVEEVPELLHNLFHPNLQPYLLSWFKYDPRTEIAKLGQDILILQGTTDIQIQVKDAEALAEAANGSTLSIIEGMNHILKITEEDRNKNLATYYNATLPIPEKLFEVINEFLKK